jgi:hypothetical protein
LGYRKGVVRSICKISDFLSIFLVHLCGCIIVEALSRPSKINYKVDTDYKEKLWIEIKGRCCVGRLEKKMQ